MFIGHYSAALALKRVEKKASLGWLFLAVQFPDILFSIFVLLGIERLDIIENFTKSTHFRLVFFPYSHSLLASVLWAALAYVAYVALPSKERARRKQIALGMAAAVLSHWILDLVVHTPDLPLLGDNSPKLGLGLWNNAPITFTLEAALLLAGLWLYLRRTRATTATGKYGMPAIAGVLVALNAFNTFGPPPSSPHFLAISSLVIHSTMGAMAFWLDSKRD